MIGLIQNYLRCKFGQKSFSFLLDLSDKGVDKCRTKLQNIKGIIGGYFKRKNYIG